MSNNLKIFALGGLQQNGIGMNSTCFEGKEEIIIIDYGIKFINDNNLADGEIPDFSYLIEKKSKIRGLFITHGHEDHIGGIPYLLKNIPDMPIYGSDFTISLLQGKLRGKWNKEKKHVFEEDTIINTKEFRISFFPVKHSIPDSYGIMVEFLPNTPENFRTVVTGDFKFDWGAPGGNKYILKLLECGKKGVNLLLSDSTNALIKGHTPSESEVIKNIKKIITGAEGMVIIALFASHGDRLKKFVEIAKTTGRMIVVLGSSLEKNIKKISSLDNSLFLEKKEINNFPDEKLIVLCTGSQGERRSALMKIADGINPYLKLKKNSKERTTIIYSSSPIMDNAESVKLYNHKLYFNWGVKIHEKENESSLGLTHVSGHASALDLKLMLTLLINPNPRDFYFMPFHGGNGMRVEHGKIGKEVGVPEENIFIIKNGEILITSENKKLSLSKGKINLKPTFIFNERIISSEDIKKKLYMREKMAKAGVITIFISQKSLSSEKSVYIFTCGFIDMKKNKKMFDDWKLKINEQLKKNPRLLRKQLEEYVEIELLKNWPSEKPLVHVSENLIKN